MSRVLASLSWCLVLVYPFVVLFGLRVLPLHYLGIFLVVLAGLRLMLLGSQGQKSLLPMLLSLILLLVAVHTLLANDPKWLRFYPVAVNAVMLGIFVVSLWRGPSFIERLARISEPDLSSVGVAYTRKVTVVWCLFFAGNGLVALYTSLYSSFDTWAIYNGAIAYVLIGILFGVEWLVRCRVKGVANGDA